MTQTWLMPGLVLAGLTAPGLVKASDSHRRAEPFWRRAKLQHIPEILKNPFFWLFLLSSSLIFMLLLKYCILHLFITNSRQSCMKRFSLFLMTFLLLSFFVQSQRPSAPRKYPSILWEITGNGIRKPSYLIGTMHVSSKIAFNLPDSFYYAIRQAQVVALETNPETWQEDMNRYDLGEEGGSYGGADINSMPDDYLSVSTLKFFNYDNRLARAMYSNPSTINNLLYRSYGNMSADFEEDTYLDMYIYQAGKKWGKKVAGVEDYGESMRLMAEAYKDAARDKNRKERSYGDMDGEYSSEKLQEAYRKGDLDLLDSINMYNSFSPAFDEKFLYRRNEIQARSIDSIIKTGAVLFVGVGAAHLPGDRGVIEILRRAGYSLRPVKMGERASREKEMVDRIRVPVQFRTVTSPDGFFKVDIPGKFYTSGEESSLDQQQYADMANGSYYMVTRVMTNAWMWNHSPATVLKKVDSLLYENIPGKILSKQTIQRNGYRGYDITNRTRRGDIQRYHIFVTPFEVLFFKMSGTGEYVKNGEEARRFFSSIRLKEYLNGSNGWKNFSPPGGGFSVLLPHEPFTGNDGSWIFDAQDSASATQFRVIRTDIHNYGFAEEDSFDLGLMEESFMASEFMDTVLLHEHSTWQGYPALNGMYRDKDSQLYRVRYIIRGPHYYTLVAHGKQEHAVMQRFLDSFSLTPFQYGVARTEKDTSLYFSVNTPVFPREKKIKLDIPRFNLFRGDEEEEEPEDAQMEAGAYRSRVIANDTTGEKIYVSFFKASRYYYTRDSSRITRDSGMYYRGDSTWIIKKYRKELLPGNRKSWDILVTDTGSSRAIWYKVFYRDGITYTLTSLVDTLSPPSAFLHHFYESFKPADTLSSVNPYLPKATVFFQDLASTDSLVRKKAIRQIRDISLDTADFPALKAAIEQLDWNMPGYLQTKKALIFKLGDMPVRASADYLKQLYYALGDTVELIYPVLESLLQHRNSYAYTHFKTIITDEPPVLEFSYDYLYNNEFSYYSSLNNENYKPDNGRFLDELSDSLSLTKTILPALLPLLTLEDYKTPVMELLQEMADSNRLQPADYAAYFNQFLLEARLELKKQLIAEKKMAIRKAEESKKESADNKTGEEDEGNEELGLYTALLMPFWDEKPAVPSLISQLLSSGDKKLKYELFLLLLRKNRPCPDSLFRYFAGQDEYRFRLYADLKELGKEDRFPSMYNNHLDLGRSALLSGKRYNRPDSLVYADRLPAEYKGHKGYFYFFRYKNRKDDLGWKLAVAGLVPENPREFEFTDSLAIKNRSGRQVNSDWRPASRYNFTRFTETRIIPGAGEKKILGEELRKLLYARRKSARQFYNTGNEREDISAVPHLD